MTLGCKVNQYETQYVQELLESSGYTVAPAGSPADLCVVNTCTVTADGDAKGRQLIRRLHRDNPAADLVVMGCYATRDPEGVRRLPGVTRVIVDKQRLPEELADYGVTAPIPGISRFDGHQRAFVKVQDGCLLNCSYCIIPTVRPTVRSRSLPEIAAEVERLVAAGYHEVVLTGIHLGHYGIDLSKGRPKSDWTRLPQLLERLEEIPGDFRIRLSSLEAAEVRDDLVRTLAASKRICPHLHLCLQSGSDRVLARMKRRYRAASFLERCRRIRNALDHPAFTTDVIVGFPGETESDFAETLRVVREVGFAGLHVFTYSPRAGTPAAEWRESVPPAIIADRRDRELVDRYGRSLRGRRLEVVVEGAEPSRPGHVRGTSCRGLTTAFRGYAPALLRRLIPVRALAWDDGVLLAEAEPDAPGPQFSTAARSSERKRVPLELIA
jgi:threonylcarbamoyladenosine tRNA methylthiotransferase MtaB